MLTDTDEFDAPIVSTCPSCKTTFNSNDVRWSQSINLTRDTLFFDHRATYSIQVDEESVGDIAYDFCDIDCFADYLFFSLEALGAKPREDTSQS